VTIAYHNKSQHHGLAKVGITTTKTPLSSGFKAKSEKQNHQFSSISSNKKP
jgi:hypothetical protein